MDIQKEREAFECEFKQTSYYIAHGDISTLMLCDDQYALDDVQVSFEMWQAAKTQAVPKGFVLVEREKLAMIFETATNALIYHAAPPRHDALSIIQGIARKAMIESQEPK